MGHDDNQVTTILVISAVVVFTITVMVVGVVTTGSLITITCTALAVATLGVMHQNDGLVTAISRDIVCALRRFRQRVAPAISRDLMGAMRLFRQRVADRRRRGLDWSQPGEDQDVLLNKAREMCSPGHASIHEGDSQGIPRRLEVFRFWPIGWIVKEHDPQRHVLRGMLWDSWVFLSPERAAKRVRKILVKWETDSVLRGMKKAQLDPERRHTMQKGIRMADLS